MNTTTRGKGGGLLSAAGSVVDRLGIRRTRFGRRLIAAFNVAGAHCARLLYLRRGASENVGGHRMFLSDAKAPSVAFVSSVLHERYEAETTALFQEILHEGMTVFDVGAHVGYYTLLAARLVGPRGRVYAFEPEPENFALLQRNVELNGYSNVVCVPKAISDRTGALTLYVSSQGNDRHSIMESRESSRHVTETVVSTITLDEFAESVGWPKVDTVKMDIEGAEPLAVAGMRRLLQRSVDLSLIIEFAPRIIEAGGTAPAAFLRNLASLGFTIEPVEADVPRTALAGDMEGLEEIEKRGVVNLLCRRTVSVGAGAGGDRA